SLDGGAVWSTMSHPNFTVNAFGTSAGAASTVYSLQFNFFRSTDNGTTWTAPAPNFFGWFDGDLVVHPANGQTLYLAGVGSTQPAGGDGIYKATDGGSRWSPINTGLPTPAQFHTLAIDPQNGETVFAGVSGAYGNNNPPASIYRTTDGGAHWTPLTNGLLATLRPSQIVVAPSNSSIVYASATSSGSAPFSAAGVYKSVDGGDHWSQVFQQNVYAIAVDPTDPNIVYATGWQDFFYRSLDGGSTWKQFTTGMPASPLGINAIALDPANPRHLFIGTTPRVDDTTFAARRPRGTDHVAS